MTFTEIRPHPGLRDHIDTYWLIDNEGGPERKLHILPDGCVDLIFNLRGICSVENGNQVMRPMQAYLAGTMTTAQETCLGTDSRLIGVRFKPAHFSSFFNFAPLHSVTNTTIPCDASFRMNMNKMEQQPVSYLDQFFSNNIRTPTPHLTDIINDITIANGQITIHQLAKRNYITVRSLERQFQKFIGLSPKEFTAITRFRFALQRIQQNRNKESLLNIAFDCGYYDHAHLANDIKKYTGRPPSSF